MAWQFDAADAAALPTFAGTTGHDRLRGTKAADSFDVSQGGHDTVVGSGGADLVYFGGAFDARDRVTGGFGEDAVVLRGAYRDVVEFAPGQLVGVEDLYLAGNATYRLRLADVDHLDGVFTIAPVESGRLASFEIDGSAVAQTRLTIDGALGGDDVLIGGQGDDSLYGFGGSDLLSGGDGNDYVRGDYAGYARGRDHIVLFGGAGGDSVLSYNGLGHAVLSGDAGDDNLTGGTQVRDVFYFEDNGGDDTVGSFQLIDDTIWINSATAHSFADLTITDEANGTMDIAWGAGTSIHLSVESALPGFFLTAEDFRFGANAEVEAARARLGAFGADTVASATLAVDPALHPAMVHDAAMLTMLA